MCMDVLPLETEHAIPIVIQSGQPWPAARACNFWVHFNLHFSRFWAKFADLSPEPFSKCFSHDFPLTFRNCFNTTTGFTRSTCAAITSSTFLYAKGVSSNVPSVLSHSTPAV